MPALPTRLPARLPRAGRALAAAVLGALLAACAAPPRAPGVGALRLIGEQRIAHLDRFAGTVVGGLSGAAYDAARERWLLVSDDRCQRSAARYYEAQLDFDAQAFRAVRLSAVHYLRRGDGGLPGPGMAGCEEMDVESLRIDPQDGSLWYASEGDRRIGIAAFVRHIGRDGRVLGELALPPLLRSEGGAERGPRYNLSFEGLDFAPDGRSLWLSLEAPLYQDGMPPTPTQGAMVRMTELARDGRLLRQFAYPLDPIPVAPAPGKAAETGVSEILALDGGELLVLERASSQRADGQHDNYVRLYVTDTRAASDVAALPALAGAAYTPAGKRLLLDLNSLGLPRIDNLEGMGWGPRLPNGHATLLLVSDDNFGARQVTQLLLFEVLP